MKWNEALDRLEVCESDIRKLLADAYAELGEEELITDRLNAAMAMYESAFKHMSAFIEKSEGIESFEPEAFTKVDIVFEEE
jgi:hypothetical protein